MTTTEKVPARRQAPRRLLLSLSLTLGLALTQAPLAPASAAPAECVEQSPGGPVWVTSDCVDPVYAEPVIDARSDAVSPVVHHRVAGHFEGTDIQFTIYLPPASKWKGRFFQFTYPVAFTPEEDTSRATDRAIGFALSSGGYAVQAGNASVSLGYRHGAAAAKFAETVAADYYGTDRRIYGYLYGPSGGSYQTIGAAENTTGVWEGFVPMVIGVPMSNPYTFQIRAMARLVLADKVEQIADAVRPGGSGRPFAGLDAAERVMLRELTAFGVPLRGWENPDYLLGIATADNATIRAIDPTYVEDFWSQPGYLGTEQSPLGDAVRAALAEVGDTVDNRWDIALRSYYRHQLPPATDGYVGFDQFRGPDLEPLYPQRPLLVGPLITGAVSGGATYDGQVNGKVIVVDNLYDVDALPYHADWYAHRVRSALGERAFDKRFRLYYNDHADHLDAPVSGVRETYLVNWYGMVEQALRDVSAWAERGVTPPASTQYRIRNAQVLAPRRAADRRGIQPVVHLAVERGDVTHVRAGQKVAFRAKVQTPPRTGKVVTTEWDFEGDGTYAAAPFGPPRTHVLLHRRHRFDTPGTYFVALRVTAQRNGRFAPYAKLQNLGRVRVVVHPAAY